MRKVSCLLLAVTSAACITSFKHPLGSPDEASIDSRLVGDWSCTSSDDPKPMSLTIMDFDGKQLLVTSVEAGASKTEHFRAFATRLEDLSVLNLQQVASGRQDEWMLLAYDLADKDQLRLRIVDPEPFEHVLDDPAAVGQLLLDRREDPEVVRDSLTCGRRAPEER